MADHFLHHRADLIDLDGIDDEVLCLILVFLSRIGKARGSLLNAVVDDVGEADEHGCGDVAQRQLVNHVLEIDFHSVFEWSRDHVPLIVDMKIIHTPSVDAVQLVGIFYTPLPHTRILF